MTGEELRKRRKDAGLTQQQLADMVGCTANYVLMVEGNHRKITRPQPFELALFVLENGMLARFLAGKDTHAVAQAVPAGKPKKSSKKK